jgi:tRNA A37 methylthiotransferase MiaB
LYYKLKKNIFRKFYKEKLNYARSIKEKQDSYYISISEGCLGNCSYCSVKKAVGDLQSKPLSKCIEEFKKGLNLGYKNFILLAEDHGAYGKDINSDFPTLLDEFLKIKGNYEIDIGLIHPVWFVKYAEEFQKLLSGNNIKKICIPVQSGSNRILNLMNRYSNVEKIIETFNNLKKVNPSLIIGVHFIVGFPTETLEDFEKTLNLLSNCNFNYGAFYPFSIENGCEAENIKPQLKNKEIKKRLKIAESFLKKSDYEFDYYKNGLMFLKP